MKNLLYILIFITNSIDLNSQRYFATKVPGFLGKKFFVSAGIGNAPLCIFANTDGEKTFSNIKSSMLVFGGINYTITKKNDIGLYTFYNTQTLDNPLNTSITNLFIQARLLASNQIAPLGNRVGIGVFANQMMFKDSSISDSKLFYGMSLVMERNMPINKHLMLSYGIDLSSPFNAKDYNIDLISFQILRINFGLSYLLF